MAPAAVAVGWGAKGSISTAQACGAIPHALTGALSAAHLLADTLPIPPGLYKLHTFVWFPYRSHITAYKRLEC